MDSSIETLSWWSLTSRVLFSPRVFFAQFPEPFSYRKSLMHLIATALASSLINALVLTSVFFIVASSFASIFAGIISVLGTLLSPLIAVAAKIPLERVPALVVSFSESCEAQVGVTSAKFGAIIFVGNFCLIVISTCLQAGLAHVIARLLRCAGGFRSTLTAYALGSAAWMFSAIPLVNLLVPFYGGALDILGMLHIHGVSGAKATLAVSLAAAIAVALMVISMTLIL